MSKKVKWSLFGAVIIGVAAFAATTAARRGGKPTEVRIEAVQKRDLVASVTASGQVQPRTKVNVAADISGRIVRLAVKEGQMVQRGQFLLEIDPAQYEAAVQRAEAGLSASKAQMAQARANHLQAQRNFERSDKMRQQNANLVTQEQLEQLKTQTEVTQALLEAATHQVEQSQAALSDAKSQLSKTTILAPMSGRVTRLAVEQGETAVPGTFNKDAATLLTISDMTVLETKVKVDETDVARISVGDSALIQIDAFTDTTFVGRVVKISNSSVKGASAAGAQGEQAVDYEVTIELLNPPVDTRPDFSATAKVVTETRTGVISIPIIALTVRENEALESADTAITVGRSGPAKDVGKKDVEGVFIVGADDRVTFRPVRVGIAGEKYFEVLDGLRDGERIVGGTYQAIRELKDNTLVREAKKDDKKPQVTKS
jgi:HlyD family secretion protein